jgi:hypothetical protein
MVKNLTSEREHPSVKTLVVIDGYDIDVESPAVGATNVQNPLEQGPLPPPPAAAPSVGRVVLIDGYDITV